MKHPLFSVFRFAITVRSNETNISHYFSYIESQAIIMSPLKTQGVPEFPNIMANGLESRNFQN